MVLIVYFTSKIGEMHYTDNTTQQKIFYVEVGLFSG